MIGEVIAAVVITLAAILIILQIKARVRGTSGVLSCSCCKGCTGGNGCSGCAGSMQGPLPRESAESLSCKQVEEV